jgi:hypothetical protein
LPVAWATRLWKRKSAAAVSPPAAARAAYSSSASRMAARCAALRLRAASAAPSLSMQMRSSRSASRSTTVAISAASARKAGTAAARGDEGAHAVARLHQPRRLQLGERLAHDGAAHGEALDHLRLGRQAIAGTQHPLADLARELRHHALGSRHVATRTVV